MSGEKIGGMMDGARMRGTASALTRGISMDFLLPLVVVACAYLYNAWMLDVRHFFHADDWYWLDKAVFLSWADYLTVLPIKLYNDRPVGAAFYRLLYETFGLNHVAFQWALLSVHAANSVMLHFIASHFTTRGAAFAAAVLAATWFATLNCVSWAAAIFDLLGATLCLLTLLLWQISIKRGGHLGYTLASAAAYLLAIRTKEFAIGMVVVLFLMSVLVERKRIKETVINLWPMLLVFGVYAFAYAHLYMTAPLPEASPYRLEITTQSLLASLWFYFSEVFYRGVIGVTGVVMVGLSIVAGIALGTTEARRNVLWGLASFVVMLGPTLLLSRHLDALYLYAPHFFLALALASLLGRGLIASGASLAIGTAVLAAPVITDLRFNVIGFTLGKGEIIRSQFLFAKQELDHAQPGTQVFVDGVEPYFNVFSNGPGWALNVAYQAKRFDVVVEKPEADMLAEFCRSDRAKLYFRFNGAAGADVTDSMQRKCQAR